MKKRNLIIFYIFLCSTIFGSFRKDVNQGNKLFYKQKYEEAQEKYNSAEIKNPNSFVIYYNKGNNFYKQKLYEEALKEYQKALGLTKDKNLKSKILYNIGNTYLKVGDFEKAKEAYKQALINNPNDEDIKYNLQFALKELENKSKFSENKQKQRSQEEQNKEQAEQQQKRYMSEQDIQRLLEAVKQQQKDRLKEAFKPQKPQLPPVDKDW